MIDRAGAGAGAVLPLRRLPRARTAAARNPSRRDPAARAPPSPRSATSEPSPPSPCRCRRASTRPTSPTSPLAIADRPPLTPTRSTTWPGSYRCRLESLLAVDEGVERIVDALRDQGELDNTLIVYTSDNGFFAGEHRSRPARTASTRRRSGCRCDPRPRGPRGRARSTTWRSTPTSRRRSSMPPAPSPAGSQDGESLLPFAAHPERRHGRELLIEQYGDAPDEEGQRPAVDYVAAMRTIALQVRRNGDRRARALRPRGRPVRAPEPASLNPAYDAAEAALAARLASLRDVRRRELPVEARPAAEAAALRRAARALMPPAGATSSPACAGPTSPRLVRVTLRASAPKRGRARSAAPCRSRSGSSRGCCAASPGRRSARSPSSSTGASSACRSGCGSVAERGQAGSGVGRFLGRRLVVRVGRREERNRAEVVCSSTRRQAESFSRSRSTWSSTWRTRRAEISIPWRSAIAL